MSADGGEWQRLETSTAEWTEYGDKQNAEIEEAFKGGEVGCELVIGGQLYWIDFNAMVQTG
eukprot:CAMPEP_0173422512 /NCGR_PEP_ID=MMETSP1357-20121228/3191_1 /TAXON_ID=77926 /ORGANISM="Hemiselmis rufescens, Strain PCC563" /LENGTH=60 /DNA_ID=CAMNT_0014385541 /DNA_START=85 /DNA_END=264 /DNA_ORIENTATION=-